MKKIFAILAVAAVAASCNSHRTVISGNVLGIEEDYIPLMDFCRMWENNNRAIWEMNIPDEQFNGITADIYYNCFMDDYEQWQRDIDEVEDE